MQTERSLVADRRTRAIFFRTSRRAGADVSKLEGRPEFQAAKEGDLHLVRVGGRPYEIPDAVAPGGRYPLAVRQNRFYRAATDRHR